MIKLTTILAGLGKLWLEPHISRAIRLNLIMIVVQIALIITFFSQLPPQVPLYYSRPWGEAQLAPTHHLFILPLIATFFLLLNSLLSLPFLEKAAFVSISLIWTSVIASGLGLITLIKIISVIL